MEELLKKRGKLDELSSKTGGNGNLAGINNTISRHESAKVVRPAQNKDDLDLDFMDGGSKKTSGLGKPNMQNTSGVNQSQAGSKPKLFGNPAPGAKPTDQSKDHLAAPVQPPIKKFTTGDEEKIGDMSFKPITEGKYPATNPKSPSNSGPVVVPQPKPSVLPKPQPAQKAVEKSLDDDWGNAFGDKGLTNNSNPANKQPAPAQKPTPPKAAVVQPTPATKPKVEDEAFDLGDF